MTNLVTVILLAHCWVVETLGILELNKYLDVPSIATYEIIGLKGCAKECYKRRGQCVALNYQKEHLICHLLDTTSATAPDKLKNKVGFTYSEINTWIGDFDSSCGTVSCGADKMCVELKSGETTCQVDPTSCPKGKFFNDSGCTFCPADEYQPLSGQANCSVCQSGPGAQWKRPSLDKTVCQGCWNVIGTYTEGDNPNRMSTHTVADRNECYLLCEAQPSCLAVKSAKSNTECSLFSTKTWAYGYVFDSVVILVCNHCRP
ncbi:uncharacterized protein [Magallana gigas]|uniref:uncharacterized protein n=1 Tax=Magallana gigas TaxID=29159 RepID=UPI00333E5553